MVWKSDSLSSPAIKSSWLLLAYQRISSLAFPYSLIPDSELEARSSIATGRSTLTLLWALPGSFSFIFIIGDLTLSWESEAKSVANQGERDAMRIIAILKKEEEQQIIYLG